MNTGRTHIPGFALLVTPLSVVPLGCQTPDAGQPETSLVQPETPLGQPETSPVETVKEDPRPNVVWILCDALRAQNLSCHGYERPTPTIREKGWQTRGHGFEPRHLHHTKSPVILVALVGSFNDASAVVILVRGCADPERNHLKRPSGRFEIVRHECVGRKGEGRLTEFHGGPIMPTTLARRSQYGLHKNSSLVPS